MIVPAFMNHDCTARDIRKLFDTRGQNGVGSFTLVVDIQCWQITHMAFAPWITMLSCFVGVVVTASCARRHRLAVLPSSGFAAGLLMDMKAVDTRRQALDIGREYQAVLGLGNHDRARGLSDTFSVDLVHGYGDVGERVARERGKG